MKHKTKMTLFWEIADALQFMAQESKYIIHGKDCTKSPYYEQFVN